MTAPARGSAAPGEPADPALVYFDPAPPAAAAAAIFASPFDPGEPHPLARRAADELIAQLRRRVGRPHRAESGGAADPVELEVNHGRDADRGRDELDAPGGGKMFGVLVVATPGGRLGYLRGFSGMLDGAWWVPGFVPPLFDAAARDAFWADGQRRLAALDERVQRAGLPWPSETALRAAHRGELADHAGQLADLRTVHRDRRLQRRSARDAIRAAPVAPSAAAAALHALDQASRGDAAERRSLLQTHAGIRASLAAQLAAVNGARDERAAESRALMRQVHDTYVIASARGERRPLRDLFAPGEPPSGAGDCAGPKLLGHAYRLGLTPLALAELWWGAPPASGGRHTGQLYPSCRGKCGPLLPFMLDGLALAAAPRFGGAAIAGDEPRIVFEDPWLIVVDKPCGLLSVPGREPGLHDSVITRLRARWPGATAVHRLDLETSGLLVAAKDPATHTALQRAFARREVDKRYVAWLDGVVTGDHGTIDLPLRVDLDDRPRQLVDPLHGKPAVTAWRVLDRTAARTRVHLLPRTGRSHQLRVHAAHPLGLAAPIIGDRLYGRAAARLALHAEWLAFTHPHTQRRVSFERAAPF